MKVINMRTPIRRCSSTVIVHIQKQKGRGGGRGFGRILKRGWRNPKTKDFNPIGYGALDFPSRDNSCLSPTP